MRIKSERDFWSGLAFVVVGVVFAIGATHYAIGPDCPPQDACAASAAARFAQLSAQPGPGYFPLGLGVLLALVGAVVLFKALVLESEGGDPVESFAWRPLLAVVGGIVVFGVALEPLGLVLAVPLLVVIASLASGERRWRSVLASAVVLTIASWLILVVAMKVAVPLWPRLAG